jgi:lipid II:glycine glycyltransferase (peptidoglycan interpeptide bridge formation enzyme)
MPIVSLSEWNQFIASHPNTHLLQTGEWGELKSEFGWKPIRLIEGNVGAQILFRRLPFGLTVGYIPKGPVCKSALSADSATFWRQIDTVCKKNRAVFCKFELDAWDTDEVKLASPEHLLPPDLVMPPLSLLVGALFKYGWRMSQRNIQPPRTMVIDLKGSDEDILLRMKQKTRYNIRLAEKKGVTVRAWDDLESFHKMMLVTGGRDRFGVHSLAYYKRAYQLFSPGMCRLLVAEYDGKPLASIMVFARDHRAWYVYGASTDEERNRMPTYLLQWEAIQWAKTRGCVEYDLWGVPDENEEILEANFESRHDGLWGVYRFKRGFGGQLKRAVQAMDKVYNPLLYWAYLKFIGSRE